MIKVRNPVSLQPNEEVQTITRLDKKSGFSDHAKKTSWASSKCMLFGLPKQVDMQQHHDGP